MASVKGIVAGLLGFAVGLTAMPAFAQSNLDAGKSPAQIFAHTCNACHRSPREIKRTTAAFMREHYTTGMQEATTMAAYLNSVGTDPKAVETRRKPVLGAGREPPPSEQKPGEQKSTEQKPAEQKPGESQQAAVVPAANGKPAANGRVRRPAESFEADSTLAASFMADQPPTAPPPAPAAIPASEVEE